MSDISDPAMLVQQLSADAIRLEPSNPHAAISRWRQTLALLPPESPAHAAVSARIAALADGWQATPVGEDQALPEGSPGAQPQYQPRPASDPPAVALAKTIGSMALSIGVYYYFSRDLWFSVGFVLLMLVHEMGHVLAMWHYKLPASPPIFVPFMGAVINMRESPPNALVESVVGIAGPVLGTIGALVCFAAALASPNPSLRMFLLGIANFGFFLNLFNLLPVPPLDGGRVTAAISPWIWMFGIVALGAGIVYLWRVDGRPSFIMLFIFIYALPRIRQTLARRGRDIPYYRIPRRASWTMAALYIILAVSLVGLFMYCNGQLPINERLSFA